MLHEIGRAASRPRAALIALATRSHASALRLDTTTLAPCSARRRTIASPMPLVEPVTSATFPVRSNSSIPAPAFTIAATAIDNAGAGLPQTPGHDFQESPE